MENPIRSVMEVSLMILFHDGKSIIDVSRPEFWSLPNVLVFVAFTPEIGASIGVPRSGTIGLR